MSSVFDRLYKQETAARARNKDEAAVERKRNERKRTESAKKKKAPLKLGPTGTSNTNATITTQQRRTKPSSQASQSSFERLFHQETASSIALKASTGTSTINNNGIRTTSGSKKSLTPKKKETKRYSSGTNSSCAPIYDRLYKRDTLSSRNRKDQVVEQIVPTRTKQHTKLNEKNYSTPKSTLNTPINDHMESLKLEDELDQLLSPTTNSEVDSQKIAISSSSSQTKLRIASKYSPEEGFKDLSATTLNLTATLRQFGDSEITEQTVAREIINALFERDFTPGKHWDIDSATVSPLDSSNGDSQTFDVVKEATWDWKDIYSVASSKATIHFLKGEIRIENYSYYVAG